MRVAAVRRLCALPEPRYRQGQRPEPGIREYFYYVDHHGQLFLDDAKVKNFITCFKDVSFLSFFFSRLERNRSGRHQRLFPFLSRCGRERNFLRCADLPVVFTQLLPGPAVGTPLLSYCGGDVSFLSFFFSRLERNRSGRHQRLFPFLSRCGRERNFLRCADLPVVFTQLLPGPAAGTPLLSYCGGGSRLAVPFQPGMLTLFPPNGRLYHPAPRGAGGVGLVSSALAQEWSSGFRFEDGPQKPPTHFWWDGRSYRLSGELLGVLEEEKAKLEVEEVESQ